jgi:hypothetical protein
VCVPKPVTVRKLGRDGEPGRIIRTGGTNMHSAVFHSSPIYPVDKDVTPFYAFLPASSRYR